MIALLWLVGCGGTGGWTEAGALAPSLAVLDVDHDGRVTTTEYERVHLAGAAKPEADTNLDGVVSADELTTLLTTVDPASPDARVQGKPRGAGKGGGKGGRGKHGGDMPGDGAGPKRGNGKKDGHAQDNPKADAAQKRRESQLELGLVLESLRQEIAYAQPAAALPTDRQIADAVASGSLYTQTSRDLLRALETAADTASVPFPASLRAAIVAGVPVAEPLPPLPGPQQTGFLPLFDGEAKANATGGLAPGGPGGRPPGGPGGRPPGGPGAPRPQGPDAPK